jgi:S-adenosylmethionine hydrolase
MAIITLITDFGLQDAYVGVMKGAVLTVNQAATIVDITHNIEPQNIILAAHAIKNSYCFFPVGTIHVVVVDPGVGTGRSILALEMSGYRFLAPDNGVLTFILQEGPIDAVVRVDNAQYFANSVSRTFHGRDIIAPVAGHLSMNLKLTDIGTPVDPVSLVHLNIRYPYRNAEDELIGTILSVDHFGNILTDITQKLLSRFLMAKPDLPLRIRIGTFQINGLSKNYASGAPETPLAIINSNGYLEIAIKNGNASRFLDIKKKTTIRVGLNVHKQNR